jgi:DNA-binding FadR family transcriptional regulator
MKDITPIRKTKRADEVVRAIENLIIDNNMQPGDKIPSQPELSASLQVGSRSIREAIRSLESRGLLETKQGKGVFIKNNNMEFFLEMLKDSLVFHLPKEKKTLLDLAHTRKMIETNVIYNIAVDTPPGFISEFSLLLDLLDEKAVSDEIEAYNLLDVELHKMLIKASGNNIIISVYNHLFELLVRSFQKTGGMRGSKETSQREHRQMLVAIMSSDGESARNLMEKHIDSTIKKLEDMAFPDQARFFR